MPRRCSSPAGRRRTARVPDVQRLCERIVVAQRDEIALMQNWLREKGQTVPAANSMRMHMTMDGMTHDMLMPGMLTDEELKELDASRGSDFDRLFLSAMIRHHQGAISMVDDLEHRSRRRVRMKSYSAFRRTCTRIRPPRSA